METVRAGGLRYIQATPWRRAIMVYDITSKPGRSVNSLRLNPRPIRFAIEPSAVRHIGRHEPGLATIEPLGGEGAAVEDGRGRCGTQNSQRGLVAQIRACWQSGEAIAHGVVYALDLPDM